MLMCLTCLYTGGIGNRFKFSKGICMTRLVVGIGLWLLCGLLLAMTVSVRGADNTAYTLQPVADGFTFPTTIIQAPQDSTRLFIADLSGKVSIIKQGVLLPTPFLDLSKQIVASASGAGLHNIVFHPDYAQNGVFYVVYTLPDRDEVLMRRRAGRPGLSAASMALESEAIADLN